MSDQPQATTGRSTLLGRTAKMVGFAFRGHPIKPHHYVQVTIYQVGDDWVICTSEGRGSGSRKLAREGLGKELPSSLIAPFAQRKLSGPRTQAELKSLFTEDPTLRFEWAKT